MMGSRIYHLPDGRTLTSGQPFSLDGFNYPHNWLENVTPDQLAARGISVEDVPPPEPESPTVSDLLAYLADKRWRVETGGCISNGMTIATDRDSQVKIAGAWSKAKSDPHFQITNWKLGQGVFVPLLDNAAIIAIGDAVTAHIQACFDKEAELTAAIMADPPTIEAYAEIDSAAWPPNA